MLLFTLAYAAAPPPIVNGTPTDDYPQAVLLRRATSDWSTVYVCSGTLVASDWVLTAAHCVVDPDHIGLTEMYAFVGSEWSADAEEIAADDWLPHPDYYVSADGMVIDNDLGLVHLSSALELAPIPLNTDAITEADVGEVFHYVGWGASDDYAYDAGTLKREADIPLVGLEDEFILGYDERGAATCGGDSGGPILRMLTGGGVELVAAHSFGRDDDGTLCAGSTSGDTRVDLYVEWIQSVIGVGEEEPEGDTAVDVGEEEQQAGCGCASTPGPWGWVGVLAAGVGLVGRRRGL